MANHEQTGIGTAWAVILTLLLAIILRAGLESFIPAIIGGRSFRQLWEAGPPTKETYVRICQMVVFLILLARFYWGAYRFNQEHPMDLTTGVAILNMTGTFGLFALFYVIGLNVWTLDLFYVSILVMHLFDFLWFLLALLNLKDGAPLLKPIKWFIAWDVLTVIVYISLSWFLWNGFWSGADLSLQVSLLVVLSSVSFLDWWVLRDFYFYPTTERPQPPKAAATARAARS